MAIRNTSKPLVSIVVLNWNGLEDTKLCLENLRKLTYKNTEVIIVDNGSSQDQKDYLAKVPDITYVDNPINRGFTGGHIDGLGHCSGEFIIILNNDAVIKNDYIEKALLHFENPSVAVVGGRSYWWNDESPLFDETNPFYSYQDVNVYSAEAITQTGDYGVPQSVNNVSGSCAVIRKEAINKVGYLYERFFAYFEETDLFARMKRAGYEVLYDPSLEIWHRNGASSGSTTGSRFFYYQIFRNRFIFATRNFETSFMFRFWFIYARMTLKSFVNYVLRRGDSVMNKAYVQAAFYNLLRLPSVLASRYKLTRTLGKSNYNHLVFKEQTGLSVVVDCERLNKDELSQLALAIGKDTNPLHEYVLVCTPGQSITTEGGSIRVVVNRGYFANAAIKLGCLAARFQWMVLCEPDEVPDVDVLHSSVAQSLGTSNKLLVFVQPGERARYCILSKELFEATGGAYLELGLQDAITTLLNYASIDQEVGEVQLTDKAKTKLVSIPLVDSSEQENTKQFHDYNEHLIRSRQITRFQKLTIRHYRLFQFVTLVKWTFMFRIPLRLKLARLKNVLLFAIRLHIRNLAEELKHMRNEVLLYNPKHLLSQYQEKAINEKLKSTKENPENVPVFVICRDRVRPLKQLVSWLEEHGIRKIVFIDNDSSYPPLLAYYDETPYQVLPLARNVGHTSPWKLAITRSLVPDDFYIVTDPDVIPVAECPSDFMNHFLALHEQFFAYEKVGFSLKIDDLPDFYPLKNEVVRWESQFWKNPLADNVFDAGVDTTFALYKPFVYQYSLHPSIRTGEPYSARHLPWYGNPAKTDEEERYYRYRADHNVSSWNADVLKDRYAKEMQS